MIKYLASDPAGAAVRITLVPPEGASDFVLLRKIGAIVDPDDPAAEALDDGVIDSARIDLLDLSGLTDGVEYTYAEVCDGVLIDTATVTPTASYLSSSVDPQSLLLGRVDAGLRVEVSRGNLDNPRNMTHIEVLRSPPRFEETAWPVVTVEFQSARPEIRAIGDRLFPPETENGMVKESRGWFWRHQLIIAGWSQNPDERIALRQALSRILLANMPLLTAAGLDLIEFDFSEMDDYTNFSMPVHAVFASFNCVSPAESGQLTPEITDIEVSRVCNR